MGSFKHAQPFDQPHGYLRVMSQGRLPLLTISARSPQRLHG
jgi:hypothetical protein